MNKSIITLLIAGLSFNSFSQESPQHFAKGEAKEIPQQLSSEEEEILKEIRSGKVSTEKSKKIERVNDKYRIKREDNRILVEFMNVGDIYEVKTCFGSPFRITIGDSINDKMFDAIIGNKLAFDVSLEEKFRRSVGVTMKKDVEGMVHSTLWLIRNSDKRAYIFNITGEPCPKEGLLKYPVEIILQDSFSHSDINGEVLIPTDFVAEETLGYKRNNSIHFVNVNGLLTGSNSSYSALSFSINLKNVGTQKKIREPRFIAFNWSQTATIPLKQRFMPHSSQLEANQVGMPTVRFSLNIQIGKKQIIERKVIYLAIMYDDIKEYQIVEIPMAALLEKLKQSGMEI